MEPKWIKCVLCAILLFLLTTYTLMKYGFIGNFVGQLRSRTFGNATAQPCTFALFRQAYKDEGYFPSGGKWEVTNGIPHYQPKICRFGFPRVPRSFIQRCLAKSNTSYILTMGDSTGGKYNLALRKTSQLQFRGIRAEKLKERGFLPDKDYFAKHLPNEVAKFVKVKFRFCSGCASNLNRARFVHANTSISVDIEHIAQTMILDDSLQVVFPSYRHAATKLGRVWAITMQELVLRYYLKGKYPDVFVVLLPFAHAKQNMALSRLPNEIEYFKGLIDEYVPETTKIFYFPAYREFECAKRSEWKNHRFENMLAGTKINKMNHVLFDVLRNDLLDPSGRSFGFLDLADVSKNKGNWSTDGVHMKAVWYESVMSMFWETYCNSVFREEF